ncbi:MAG: decaprenyl-phosphate phosphoribosyltransferase [Chloroflexi bacterium]|nr:decaprenyl-phosphate phosphoribosyltransferase [Chloroflexota bacterium]
MFKQLIRAMRPKQWAKNVFVFAGVVFDGRLADMRAVVNSLAAFVVFCLISGAIYLLNDLADIEKDRQHPKKRFRPLASGALSPRVALAAAVVILVLGLAAAFWLDPVFGAIAAAYVVLMLAYNAILKHVVILDVMTVAAGFVLRVAAGAAVVHVSRFSPWLYVCTTFVALFIAINKRRHELVLLADGAANHRAILDQYTPALIDDMSSLVTTATLVAYSTYTFAAPNVPENGAMMLTIPYVLYGIFRYQYLVRSRNQGGAPEDLVLGDWPLIICCLLWAATVVAVIYWPGLMRLFS